MKQFILGLFVATILFLALYSQLWLNHQIEIAETIQKGYLRCEETIHLANECRKERNELWREIVRLKQKIRHVQSSGH